METRRVALGHKKLAYVILADKKLQYKKGRSKIAYIGTTRKGIARIATSVAYRAQQVLRLRGVFCCDARIVTCRPRQHVKTWRVLDLLA